MNSTELVFKADNLFHRYTHWHIKEFIDFGIPALIGWYIFSVSYHTDFSVSPLFWHEMKGIHHTWDLLALFIFYFIMKFGFKMSSMKSLINLVFIIAVLEEGWYITYYLTHPTQIFAMTWIFSPVNIGYALVILFYFYYNRKANLPIPLFFMISTTWTFIIWGSWFGFPLTVDFFGSTQYFFNPTINLIEILHWVLNIGAYSIDVLLWFIFIGVRKK